MRVPASQAGKTQKLWDFECPSCKVVWEAWANQQELDDKIVKCAICGTPGDKQFPSPGVDSHAAASWRR